MKKKLFMSLIPIFVFGFIIRLDLMGNQSQEMNVKLGVIENKLTKCPDKPNCVVSFYSEDSEHYITPLETDLSISEIKTILENKLGLKLKSEQKNYLYFTYTSSFFEFVDDIEIFKINNKLYFRSASRVGYSDLGANKKRVIKIKEELHG
jgi:uncharacterized protein (DUF1499 family)